MLSIRANLDAMKRRKKEETGEEGFSLIELIIVVVVLGILVAIAIPIFLGIQASAKQNAADAVAANAATQWAAANAQGSTATFGNFPDYTVAVSPATPTLDTFCITATGKTGTSNAGIVGHAGPGKTGSGATATCP